MIGPVHTIGITMPNGLLNLRNTLLCFAVALTFSSCVPAAENTFTEFRVSSVRVLNNSAEMRYHRNYLVSVVSGTLGSKGIPEVISLGDVIRVEGESIKVNYIFASRCSETIQWAGQVLCRAGQTICVVVEHPEDRPNDEERDRLWIDVRECEPLD